MKFKNLKQNQKIRLYINNVKIVGTVKQITTMIQDYSVDQFLNEFDALIGKEPETQGYMRGGFSPDANIKQMQVDLI